MRKEIDRKLLVRPDCLMFFCDDTGHEDFRDRSFPVFGIGGCAIMAGAIEPVLKRPWRELKAEHFGGPDVALHASALRNPTQAQLDALNRFFREQEFCRFGVTITPNCQLPTGLTTYHVVSRSLHKRWENLTPRFRPTPAEVAFIFEASERGDALVQRYFSDIVVTIAGSRVLAASALALQPLQQETRSIPIVFTQISDPLGSGLVASLAHPGGNITGFTPSEFSIHGKLLEMLKEVAPDVTRVAVLLSPEQIPQAGMWRAIEALAPTFR